MPNDIEDYALGYDYSGLVLTAISIIGFASEVEKCLTPRLRSYIINTVMPDSTIYIDWNDEYDIKIVVVEYAPNNFDKGQMQKFKMEIKALVAECLKPERKQN